MNLGELRTAIQARGFATDTVAAQNAVINSVYRRLAGTRRWMWLERKKTTPGVVTPTATVTLSSLTAGEAVHVDSVRVRESNGRGHELTYISLQELMRRETEWPEEPSIPRFWTLRGSTTAAGLVVDIHPTTDRPLDFEVYYMIRPPALVNDSDTPLFDPVYHDILVHGALKELAYRERDWTAYSLAQADYNATLGMMEREYGVRQRQNATHVGRSEFWSTVGQ